MIAARKASSASRCSIIHRAAFCVRKYGPRRLMPITRSKALRPGVQQVGPHVRGHARVVHQHVEPPGLLADQVEHRAVVVEVADIGPAVDRLAALCLQSGERIRHLLRPAPAR